MTILTIDSIFLFIMLKEHIGIGTNKSQNLIIIFYKYDKSSVFRQKLTFKNITIQIQLVKIYHNYQSS